MRIYTDFACDYESLEIDATVRMEDGRPTVMRMKALFRGKVDVTDTLTMRELLLIEERVISLYMEEAHAS
jgi:hypothetical protein